MSLAGMLMSGAILMMAADASGFVTLQQRVQQFAAPVAARLRPAFESAGVPYPPRHLAFVAFKDVRHLELYARIREDTPWTFIKDYRVLGGSGTLGPKLAEGDRQIPEGIYDVDSLNPNSHHYLSLRITFPNDFDRAAAQSEGREKLGGDIMIHGGRSSVGCLAVGNEAIEELFVLTAMAGESHVRVVISPTDFRDPTSRVPSIQRPWLRGLYLELRTEW